MGETVRIYTEDDLKGIALKVVTGYREFLEKLETPVIVCGHPENEALEYVRRYIKERMLTEPEE